MDFEPNDVVVTTNTVVRLDNGNKVVNLVLDKR